MKEIRLLTNVRRMRPLKVYVLEPSVTAVPCLAGGIAKQDSFSVKLYLSEDNKHRKPFKALIRYTCCLGDACQQPVASAEPVSSVTVDTGKRAGKVFDKYNIEAYLVDQGKETVLATLSVGTVCDGDVGNNGPLLVPYGSWDAKRTYRSTSDVKIFVERKRMYYVLTKLNADCVGIDPATDVKNEYWRLMDYVEYMFVNAMVADFGKIGSAVFSGDYMLSQYGVGKDGHPIQTDNGYEAFTPDMSNFIPNILLNFVTGYAHFAGKKVIFKENGDVEITGTGHINEGNIGAFHIDQKGLANLTLNEKGESVISAGAFIKMFSDKYGKAMRMCINDLGTDGFVDISMTNEETHDSTAMNIACYGRRSTALHLRANGAGERYALKSYGSVDLEARPTSPDDWEGRERIMIKGLCVNVAEYKNSARIPSNVDFIRTRGNGRSSLTFPNPKWFPGKVIYLKNTSGTWDFNNGPFLPGNGWEQQDTYTVNGSQALQLISDGAAWCVFNGW